MKQHAPATTRNRDPIASVLAQYLPKSGTVLEVGSGSGEHVLHFANQFRDLLWQPSDLNPEALLSIDAWATEGRHGNIAPAIRLDVTEFPWSISSVDAVFSANMIHISPWRSCEALIQGAGRVLSVHGVLLLYGPFFRVEYDPEPTNLAFDRSLRNRNPEWGIRHLEQVQDEAKKMGLDLTEIIEMPANNLSVVFRKVAS